MPIALPFAGLAAFLLLAKLPISEGAALAPTTLMKWRQCRGCGRNTAAFDSGECEGGVLAWRASYDEVDADTELLKLERGRVEVSVGDTLTLTKAEIRSLIDPATFSSDPERDGYSIHNRAVLSYLPGLYTNARRNVVNFGQMVLPAAGGAPRDDATLAITIPALAEMRKVNIPFETTIQVAVNIAPPDPKFTFTNNYNSPSYDRAFLCAELSVNSKAEATKAAWSAGPWSACESTVKPCAAVGTRSRLVHCQSPNELPGRGSDFSKGRCREENKPLTTEECAMLSCKGGDWSSWAKGVKTGMSVVVPTGVKVRLDTSPVRLNSLIVRGTLEMKAGAKVNLVLDSLHIDGGTFVAGGEDAPFTGRLKVMLSQNFASPPPLGLDREGVASTLKALIVKNGGMLSLHGAHAESWLRLGANAAKGSRLITMERVPSGWAVGDKVVVVSSDFFEIDPSIRVEAPMNEQRTITKVAGKRVTLSAPLKWNHYGAPLPQVIAEREVDERCEVVRLTRNIQIFGSPPDLSSDPVFGGHIAAVVNATMKLSNVAFSKLGQAGRLGRYPVHFHKLGDLGYNSYVNNCSIHDTFQRSITFHKTNGVTLHNTATYRAVGHAVFWEDGFEVDTDVKRAIVIETLPQLVSDWREDVHDILPSAFWLTNFNNKLVGCVSAGTVRGVGFWYKVNLHGDNELMSHPQALASALGKFDDNVAHSNQFSGLWIWHDWRPCFKVFSTLQDPLDAPPFSTVGSSSSKCRMGSDACRAKYNRQKLHPRFGDCTANGGVQTLNRFLSYKHRDIGTAVYLTTTNVGLNGFISVSDTTAYANVQMWRDQTGATGYSRMDRQLLQNFLVVKSSENSRNGEHWCNEAVSRGYVSKGASCASGCHAWPEFTRPDEFSDPDIETEIASKRYLVGFSPSNEGGVGGHLVRNWTFVDWTPDPSCGLQGVHAVRQRGAEQALPAGRIVIQSPRFLSSAVGWGGSGGIVAVSATSTLVSMSPELTSDVFLVGPDVLERFPEGAYCLNRDEAGCRHDSSSGCTLCSADKFWFGSWTLDLSKALAKAEGKRTETACAPIITQVGMAAGQEPYSVPGMVETNKRAPYYMRRYPHTAVVGRRYNVRLKCLPDLAGETSFATFDRMNYDPEEDPAREVELVFSTPPQYLVRVSWVEDARGGTYGPLFTGHSDEVKNQNLAALPKTISGGTAHSKCCGGRRFVRTVLGERVKFGKGKAARLSDSGLRLKVVKLKRAPASCWAPCPSNGIGSPYAYVDRSEGVATARNGRSRQPLREVRLIKSGTCLSNNCSVLQEGDCRKAMFHLTGGNRMALHAKSTAPSGCFFYKGIAAHFNRRSKSKRRCSALHQCACSCPVVAPTPPPVAEPTAVTFKAVTSGTCSSKKGCRRIRSSSECASARASLMKGVKGPAPQSKATTPGGCFSYRGARLYFNRHPVARGKCTNLRRCLCSCKAVA